MDFFVRTPQRVTPEIFTHLICFQVLVAEQRSNQPSHHFSSAVTDRAGFPPL